MAVVVSADQLYTDAEFRALGFEPCDGSRVDGVIVQADHEEYRWLRPDDVTGARAVVDGRGILDAPAFAGAGIVIDRIGQP